MEMSSPPEGCYVEDIQRVPRDGGLLPSLGQERMWLLDRLAPGNPLHSIPIGMRLRGRLDMQVLRKALEALVERHEVLRAYFLERHGQLCLMIRPDSAVQLRYSDLTMKGIPFAPKEELGVLLEAEARMPFELSVGPLHRARLVKVAEHEHILMLTMHRAVCDEWSLPIIERELAELCRALLENREPELDPLSLQYPDYAAWQRAEDGSPQFQRELEYWREQLDGVVAAAFPTDKPCPPQPTHDFDRILFELPADLIADLRRVAESTNARLFAVILAGLQLLLHRYSGRDDIVIGALTPGRRHLQTRNMVGLLRNVVALRNRFDGTGRRISDVIAGAEQAVIGAVQHQELPFERVVEMVSGSHGLDRAPIFQVMYAHQSLPHPRHRLPGLEIARTGVKDVDTLAGGAASCTADVALTLAVRDEGGEGPLSASLVYSTDLFERATAERITRHLLHVLQQIGSDPGRVLADVVVLPEEERVRMTYDWAVEPPPDLRVLAAQPSASERCVHQLIEERAGLVPDAVALVCGNDRISYRELEAQANRLAHQLRQLGVGPESVVGICLERSVELPIALLATWKAGGAYLPLDPDHPVERLRFVLADAGARVIVTSKSSAGQLPRDLPAVIVWMNADRLAIRGQPPFPPESGAVSANLAYVMYTSGSTGRPKGVAVEHRSVVNNLAWMQETYRLASSDRVVQKTPYTFDVSVFELWWPLTVGAALLLPESGGHLDPWYLAEFLSRERVTVAHFVPSMLRLFLRVEPSAASTALRMVFSSGEALSPDVVGAFYGRFPANVALHNLYGPTEATVHATAYSCTSADAAGAVPIGRPIAGVRALVMDRYNQPTPSRIPGELYLGGVALARGYLGRSDLTAEHFVPDPSAVGARLYRTGDIACWNDLAELEFLGRCDSQVKIRGLRVEPAEVEAVLREHPKVDAAVVLPGASHIGTLDRLVAFIVPIDPNPPIRTGELQRFAGLKLPAYMVPSRFVTLPELPTTTHGKLDLAALHRIGGEVESRLTYADDRDPFDEYVVVANDEEQYSIWPAVRQLPRGWHEAGIRGTSSHCLQWIGEMWNDMRPRSVREAMDRDPGRARRLDTPGPDTTRGVTI